MTNAVPPQQPANLRGAVDLSGLVHREERRAQDGANGGAGRGPVPGGVVVATDDQGFGQVLELSRSIPVVVALWASWSEQSVQLVETLERLVRARDGRLVLAAADADASPQLVQALQARAIPTLVALVGGQPVPLFEGGQPDDVIEQVFDQLLEIAARHGVDGRVPGADGAEESDEPEEPVEEPLPPLHQEAFDAISRGDYVAAASAYRTAIAQDPRDDLAVAGLAQANLLGRLQGKTLDEIRNRAASAPDDIDAQLDVADLDLSGGHVEDAFARLLELFPKLDAVGKNTVRERLLELFQVVGVEDPRVSAARQRLAMLLY
ncbi:putative thioredoxin [Agromyces flavus]|uniref:Thioredoxin n=1 Tax=Agromyces flavus TaxID=589382 RepID=A0A1H1Q5N5_9MICO|nr:tetratricopeptide repeat protein [Agromyces flavus]MCP2367799.1 putative thioredoxin [Agromyces flavus]GGI47259.1 co-chaperone YbbN [Agromyces flavus]SDS18710.1 putative thioredoxin [Agromyces flavus]